MAIVVLSKIAAWIDITPPWWMTSRFPMYEQVSDVASALRDLRPGHPVIGRSRAIEATVKRLRIEIVIRPEDSAAGIEAEGGKLADAIANIDKYIAAAA